MFKLWTIEVCEHFEDKGNYPKKEGHILCYKIWFSKDACQDYVDRFNVASAHNDYKIIPFELIIIDYRYIKYQISKKTNYWLNDIWIKIRNKFIR